jgi:hypothetical protein
MNAGYSQQAEMTTNALMEANEQNQLNDIKCLRKLDNIV